MESTCAMAEKINILANIWEIKHVFLFLAIE